MAPYGALASPPIHSAASGAMAAEAPENRTIVDGQRAMLSTRRGPSANSRQGEGPRATEKSPRQWGATATLSAGEPIE